MSQCRARCHYCARRLLLSAGRPWGSARPPSPGSCFLARGCSGSGPGLLSTGAEWHLCWGHWWQLGAGGDLVRPCAGGGGGALPTSNVQSFLGEHWAAAVGMGCGGLFPGCPRGGLLLLNERAAGTRDTAVPSRGARAGGGLLEGEQVEVAVGTLQCPIPPCPWRSCGAPVLPLSLGTPWSPVPHHTPGTPLCPVC